ncbi:MAG: hypothetical protein R3D26_14185 [Cyanobacteriota/Melainabacteria group bacterium]
MSSGSIVSELFRCVPAVQKIEGDDTPRHLGWLMLTGLGIGATIGAGIFAMPGIIAGKAGPGGVLCFSDRGLVILILAICYEVLPVVYPRCLSLQLCFITRWESWWPG